MLQNKTKQKPKLNRYIKALKHINKQRNQRKLRKNEELKVETLPQHKNSLELDLTVPLSQSSHNKTKISQ